jgi:hypothetical protein
MDIFLDLHQEAIQGVVEGFDRLIFKGHLAASANGHLDRRDSSAGGGNDGAGRSNGSHKRQRVDEGIR